MLVHTYAAFTDVLTNTQEGSSEAFANITTKGVRTASCKHLFVCHASNSATKITKTS